MTYKIDNYSAAEPSEIVVKLRCPKCRQRGTLDRLGGHDTHAVVDGKTMRLGARRCPDPECHALVFVVFNTKSQQVEVSYPAERIDFDATDIPANVLKAIEEAISCHANQDYTAAAIMVRKTLEEICADRLANGKNLKERIADLGTKIVVPKELLEGMDDLRILGNDAAHIESKVFNDIGQDEVEVAVEFAKEILKSVYQMSAMLAKLKKLRKSKPQGAN